LGAALAGLLLGGCAAITNPVAEGVRVRNLPRELLGEPREDEQPIPLTLLRQKPPLTYRVGPGDVLGIWVEGVLGEKNQPVPVHYSEQPNQPPALGYPVPVREDGTISLPLVTPIPVRGLSIAEVQEAIRQAYAVKKQILQPGSERILVTLQRPRQYTVLVVREDAGGGTATQPAFVNGITAAPPAGGSNRRGAGATLSLPAYENDVLTALARTGGLPGLDASNEVIIQRGALAPGKDWPAVMPHPDPAAPVCQAGFDFGGALKMIRIPLRLRPGEEIPFRPEDIILQEGDIVQVRARETELFYTGGLLPPGEYVLPRDYDLDVVEAVARVRGPMVSGGINQNNFTGTTLTQGIGFPSPSLLSVLRRTTGGGQVVIRIDLNRALRDPRERILVKPGDVLILQETVGEALARYFTAVFRLNFLGIFVNRRDALGTTTVTLP
jgi:protein involved in polysaccharide export with SLBB domain